MGLADGTAELTGTATGVRGPGARCAVGPTNRPGDTDTGTGPPGGRWPDPDWAGSGRPGVHLRRGFGAGLSAEQSSHRRTFVRHAPGPGEPAAGLPRWSLAWLRGAAAGGGPLRGASEKILTWMRIRNAHKTKPCTILQC